ncbi:N-acetyl sugar amidotransferase [Roseibacterium sp. SDUM158016]|uniref:N-acetyl sugar amidotransferase n=1 Tax=Roseicyclus sediminis TaxID=2980997 RepID=UPI0021CE9F9B|nr:N-acetyl sugar amidotransferase [Roseibacterium sp. SDUM158016]MCU4654162.1 N-acetyl sugar amidotransferase [Roseibacterium sp. SDUM158016]
MPFKPSALTTDLPLTDFAPQVNDPPRKYGLPADIRFCSSCGMSNQRPNSAVEFKHTATSTKTTIRFDDAGECDACKTARLKATEIDWDERERELIALCDRFRSRNGSYDCLVPGSGGKDSFYQSWMLKYKYGMNPLTVTWAPNIYTEWGWHNFNAWIHSGMDNYLMTPSGRSKRLLTRLAVENIFHPFQPFIIGQKCFAPKMALQMGIPLIFYGENEAEYGNPIEDNSSAKRSFEYFATESEENLFLGGESVASLKAEFGLSQADLSPYLPSDVSQLDALGAEVHYLGYYLKWHPQAAYYFAVENGGFRASPERTAGTFSKYNSIDDKIDDLHYYTTYIKFGIGRATYDASQEVRSGDLEREEAVALIHRYDGEFPERWADEIFAYLSIDEKSFPVAHKMFEHPMMTREYFEALTDRFRSPHLWQRDENGWSLRHRITQEA